MKCPNCGSDNCQFVTTSETHSSFLNVGDACCGSICLGPIGLLCGLCDSGSDTITKEYWVCHECGTKFSAREAQKNIERIETEKKRKSTFVFYKESPLLEEKRQQSEIWKRFDEYYQKNIVGGILEPYVVRENPSVIDARLERIKEVNAAVFGETANIMFVVTDGAGFCVAEDSMAWRGAAITFQRIQEINGFGSSIYINQICMSVSSKEVAKAFFELLCVLQPTKQGQFYESYDELLQELQSLQKQKNDNQVHYSTQQEYADYVKALLEQCMESFRQNEPAAYAEYEKVKQERDKLENTLLKVCGALAITGAIIGFMVAGLLGIIIGAIVFGVISAFVVEIFIMIKKGNADEKYLPKEIYAVMEEDEKTNLQKTGEISPIFYKEYLSAGFVDGNKESVKDDVRPYLQTGNAAGAMMQKGGKTDPAMQVENTPQSMTQVKTEQKAPQVFPQETKTPSHRFCRYCGKELKADWMQCPYCGK